MVCHISFLFHYLPLRFGLSVAGWRLQGGSLLAPWNRFLYRTVLFLFSCFLFSFDLPTHPFFLFLFFYLLMVSSMTCWRGVMCVCVCPCLILIGMSSDGLCSMHEKCEAWMALHHRWQCKTYKKLSFIIIIVAATLVYRLCVQNMFLPNTRCTLSHL